MSKRFTEAGYVVPKFMLPLAGLTLFDWSVKSFENQFNNEHFVFVIRDNQEIQNFIVDRLHAMGVKRYSIVALRQETAGQADTVQIGLDQLAIDDNELLYIFNIDTLRPGIKLMQRNGASGGLEVFRAEGSNWSFIEPEAPGSSWVKRCTEKLRISDYCCTGLYYFSKVAYFRDAMHLERLNPSSSELYVAPLFNHLIHRGLLVEWYEVPSDQVLLSGVPQEYESLRNTDFCKRFEQPA